MAIEQDLSGVLGLNAGQDLHQRALASPVLADHGVDFAFGHGDRNVFERAHAGETLRQVANFEQRCLVISRHRGHSSPMFFFSSAQNSATLSWRI